MIFGGKKPAAGQKVPIAKIHGQAFQPRRSVDRTDLERLQSSIQRYGLLSPIVLRKRGLGFELISGQRRLLACRKLGWKEIPALILDLDDEGVVDLSLSENLDRLELSALEKAESLIYISRTFPDISIVDLAHRFGVTFDFIELGAKLVTLPTLLKEALMLGIVQPTQAIELGRLPDEETMAQAVARVHRDQLSARETAALVETMLAGNAAPDEAAGGGDGTGGTPSARGHAGAGESAPAGDAAAAAEPTLHALRLCEDARAGRPLDLNLLRSALHSLRVQLEGEPSEFLDLTYHADDRKLLGIARHAVNVARIALYLGRRADLDEPTLFRLGSAALLHDVAMTRVPAAVIAKKGRLSEDERSIVEEHPDRGARYVDEECLLDGSIAQAIAGHHERPDGDGYPHGLTGDAIHPLARLVRVADAYEAMVSPRPYKESLTPSAAVQQLLRGAAHGAFDKGAVQSFVRAFSHYPIGSPVTLDGGLEATVVRAHPERPDRPIVRIHHRDAEPGTATTEIVDLTEDGAPRIVAPAPARTR
ncbi:MAG: ParB/RepB/Spo0J family partition protein [Planctomycetes bacterium]|nr:ParB/RepB/Spo0J family partition protein [Planctomycetota bacterium]